MGITTQRLSKGGRGILACVGPGVSYLRKSIHYSQRGSSDKGVFSGPSAGGLKDPQPKFRFWSEKMVLLFYPEVSS
jgi:hypothetical protein